MKFGWYPVVIATGAAGALAGVALAMASGAAGWLVLVILATLAIGIAARAWFGWALAAGIPGILGILSVGSLGLPAPEAIGWMSALAVALLLSAAAVAKNRHSMSTIAYLDARADHQTMHDELTGLLNRKGADIVAGGLVKLARRDGEAVSAALICVEDDSLQMSREDRDDAFLTAAEVAAATFRGSDVLARVSGDCLLVVAKGSGLLRQTVQERLDEGLTDRALLGDPAPSVTVGGALLAPWDEGGLPELFEQARRDLVMRWSARQQLMRLADSESLAAGLEGLRELNEAEGPRRHWTEDDGS